MSGVWTQKLPHITGSVSRLHSGLRGLPGFRDLLRSTTD